MKVNRRVAGLIILIFIVAASKIVYGMCDRIDMCRTVKLGISCITPPFDTFRGHVACLKVVWRAFSHPVYVIITALSAQVGVVVVWKLVRGTN